MKRIPGNIWLQLFLGLIAAIIGVILARSVAILSYIKYTGFELFFGIGSSGDHSPVTLVIAVVFFLLTLAFPAFIWLFLNRFGNLKSASNNIRNTTFILFATLPLWLYLGGGAFSNMQTALRTANEHYHSVRDPCIIKDGINRVAVLEATKEFQCKNGVLNGFAKTYNAQEVLVYEATYLDGQLNGTETSYYDDGKVRSRINYEDGNREGLEISYNANGNTDRYMIHDQEKTHWVYFQGPENYFESLDRNEQNIYCKNQGAPAFQDSQYTCLNNVINGEHIRYANGTIFLRENFVNGVLDGIYEMFSSGKLLIHLEFKNGKLEGTVQGYSLENGILDYEGHYTNGLQNGAFRRYNRQGNLESEVVFENGQLVKINKLPPLSELP